ncbi:hypothetical protein N5J01_02660 [Stenotrophomonas sp. GD03701]|nr:MULTISPECIES: hypothetical protein [Stenotrophomonas]MCO7500568.1 hypothetical protein [Stenotrophomonas maltophilia]MDH1387307.1 hypothetical protein [Stenotrophomonas sp. GD03701]MDH1391399.1 hypothetical protein [Stenotrophomonas sp. GD03702]
MRLLLKCERKGELLMDLDREMDKLAELIALRAQRKLGVKPKLAAVGSAARPDKLSAAQMLAEAQTRMDVMVRESHCRMIRHLVRRWGGQMQVIVDQACFGLAGIEQLPDEDLIQLHKDLERAQDCIRDGVSFEDAGLLRSRYG